jgi:hypothetical protein
MKGGGMNIFKIIYVLAIAAFLTMLVGFGISAFYQPLKPVQTEPCGIPTPIIDLGNPYPSPGTPEYEEWQRQQKECQDKWDKQWAAYNKALENYHRNVFAISYPCGLLFVILGLSLRPRLDFIKPGLLLGGIATMIYAIAQPALANEFRFIGAAVGLVVLFYVGYKTLLERKPAS